MIMYTSFILQIRCIYSQYPFFFLIFEGSLSIPEIQERLGHAINNLVKHFYKPEKEVRWQTVLINVFEHSEMPLY